MRYLIKEFEKRCGLTQLTALLNDYLERLEHEVARLISDARTQGDNSVYWGCQRGMELNVEILLLSSSCQLRLFLIYSG